MYQNIGKEAFKKDLTNTYLLLESIGNPHLKGRHIHVAGSNGKGSVSSMTASVLKEAGYKVGLYTSPHLVDYTERIRVNGTEVEKDFVIQFVDRMESTIQRIKPSFFEVTVAMAFDYFATQKTDINIIEVGLGGRLDSTNVIQPMLSVITNISLEHTEFLGNTLAEIASEKAGIIKKNAPVVIGEWNNETLKVFKSKAALVKTNLVFASNKVQSHWLDACSLKGQYQIKNLNTLHSIINTLAIFNGTIDDSHIIAGLRNISENAGLMGRWHKISDAPETILDTAHNAAGIKNVLLQLKKINFKKLHVVLGVVKDKALDKWLGILPSKAIYYACKPMVVRGLDSSILHAALQNEGLDSRNALSAPEALKMAQNNASLDDLILVFGSNFIVADVLKATRYDQQ